MFDMIGNVMKNLISKPSTRMFPAEKRQSFTDTRGKVGIRFESCIFCGICAKKCPSDAITVNRNEKTWELDPFKCVVCGACAEDCPKKCMYMDTEYLSPVYYKNIVRHVQDPHKSEVGKYA